MGGSPELGGAGRASARRGTSAEMEVRELSHADNGEQTSR